MLTLVCGVIDVFKKTVSTHTDLNLLTQKTKSCM